MPMLSAIMNGFRATEHPGAIPDGFGSKILEGPAKNPATCLPAHVEPANPKPGRASFLAHVKSWSPGVDHWGLNE